MGMARFRALPVAVDARIRYRSIRRMRCPISVPIYRVSQKVTPPEAVNNNYLGLCRWRLQDYSMSFYLRQRWRDPRLSYTPPSKKLEVIKMEGDMWTRIWTPDTFFRNEKKAAFHDITVYNRLLRLDHTGYLWYVTK